MTLAVMYDIAVTVLRLAFQELRDPVSKTILQTRRVETKLHQRRCNVIHDVASTLMRRYINVMCLLGTV